MSQHEVDPYHPKLAISRTKNKGVISQENTSRWISDTAEILKTLCECKWKQNVYYQIIGICFPKSKNKCSIIVCILHTDKSETVEQCMHY